MENQPIEDTATRMALAISLGDSASPTAAETLARLLDDSVQSVKVAAARSLGLRGQYDSVAPLMAVHGSPDDYFRQTVADSLVLLGAKFDIVPDLLANTDSENPYRRKASIWVLGELHDMRAYHAACAALSDEAEFVRRAAAFALGKFSTTRGLPWLEQISEYDTDYSVREAAQTSIGRLRRLDV